ncbi:hypothetical protein TNCV_4800561 [Trichonephila clavipes]|nr:hypothetical protein TNCV_4800561 [Trichonephila clavipes]
MEKKKHQRQSISLETKIAILDRLGKGEGSTAIGKNFNLGEPTVRAIKKNETAIRKSVISGTKLSTKFASYTKRGSDNCPTALWAILSDQENEISGEANPTYNELYLYFTHKGMASFQEIILLLFESRMRKIAHAGSTARTMVNISMEAANSLEQIYDELAALQSVFPSLKLEGNSIEIWCKFFQRRSTESAEKLCSLCAVYLYPTLFCGTYLQRHGKRMD